MTCDNMTCDNMTCGNMTCGNMIILGCERGHCHDVVKYDCKLYNVQFASLELTHTDNSYAAWGSNNTCNNDGQNFFAKLSLNFNLN